LFYVIDARNEHQRPQGPFDTKPDAETVARQLNVFVNRNDGSARLAALLTATIRGPFYAVPETVPKPHQRPREDESVLLVGLRFVRVST
jgi:hypothetical protein